MLDSYPNRWWKLNVGHFRVLLLIPGFHLSSKGFFFFFFMLWQQEASGPLLLSNHFHKFDLCLSVHTSHCSVIHYSPSQEVWFFLRASSVPYCCSWRLCEAKALFAYIMQLFPHWVLLLVQAFLESKA